MKKYLAAFLLVVVIAVIAFVTTQSDTLKNLFSSIPEEQQLAQVSSAGALPELPRVYLDGLLAEARSATPKRTITANNTEEFTAALNNAEFGDEIVLNPGVVYMEHQGFKLRKKQGSGWITIRSSAPASALPQQGQRINPSYANQLPKIVSFYPMEPAIVTDPGAHNYRFVGVEVTVRQGAGLAGALVALGSGGGEQNTIESQPYNIILDRVYIHGTPTLDFRRCLALNSGATVIIDSYLGECHGKGFDSQAIWGSNGTGPYKIVNNMLEGAGENVMFGGSDPKIPNMVPADIEIRNNHFFKPLSWIGVWSVKNSFELKIGKRILVEGNVFENCWGDAQIGYAIVLKSTNQDGGAPWSETSHLTFRNNLIKNSAHGMALSGHPETHPVVSMNHVYIGNNSFEQIGTGGGPFSGGRVFQVGDVDDFTFENNSGVGDYYGMILTGGAQQRTVIRNNVFGLSATRYGGWDLSFGSADGKGNGKIGLDYHMPGAIFEGNIMWGINPNKYPPNNYFPASPNDVGFINFPSNLEMNSSSQYRSAGVNFPKLRQMISGVVEGNLSNTAPYTPSTPVQTPAPALTFSASPTSVSGTQATTLSWSATNVSSCTASGGWSGSKASSGTFTTTLTQSTTYTLTCSGSGGSSSKNVTVSYTAPTPTQTQPITTQSPFKGIFVLPTTIQAEDFDNGGEGISYHDNVPGNAGGKYRTNESVDIIDSTDSSGGGHTVYNLEKGEWLEYSISVPQSGNYTIETRTSNNGYSPKYHIEIDGTSVASFTLPNTLSWNTFQNTAKSGIALSAGNRTLRLVVDEQYANLNWIKITRDGSQPTTPTPATPTPTTPTPPSDDCNPRQTYAKSPTTGEVRIFPAPCDVLVGWIVIPNPNQTAPTLTFNANPTVIGSNQASILTWSSTNASSCTASGDWSGSRAPSGTVTAAPTKTTTYTLSCTGVGGSVSKSVTVSYGGQGPVVPLPTTQTPSGNQTFTASLYYSLKNSEVVALQQFLRTKGLFSEEATGYFGLLTLEAVQAYQVSKGIETTGTVGPQTRAAMNAEISGGVVPKPAVNQPPTNATLSLPRNLSRGSQGIDVIALQTALKQLGYFSDEATGYYGVVTERAVQSFQRAQGIVSGGTANSTGYGVAGPRTRGVLVNAVGR